VRVELQLCAPPLVSPFSLPAIAASSCGGGTSNHATTAGVERPARPAASRGNTSVNKADYPVFPTPTRARRVGACRAGGKASRATVADQPHRLRVDRQPRRQCRAVRNRDYQPDFPNTLRQYGPEATPFLNGMIGGMGLPETLLTLQPRTRSTTFPALANALGRFSPGQADVPVPGSIRTRAGPRSARRRRRRGGERGC